MRGKKKSQQALSSFLLGTVQIAYYDPNAVNQVAKLFP